MRLQGVGGRKSNDADDAYLACDWYRRLTDKQLAAYIRYLFIYFREGAADWNSDAHAHRRPHWDGGVDSFNTKHKSIWEKIVRLIKASDAIPGIWVAAHFSDAVYAVRTATNKGTIACRPELLCSPISLNIYNEYMQMFDEQVRQQYILAESSISTRYTITTAFDLPEDDQVLLVLCDTSHVNAPAFMRHAFAADLKCDRAVKKFILPAALEYDTKQYLYDKFIASNPEFDWFISADLLKFVAGIRKHWRKYA